MPSGDQISEPEVRTVAVFRAWPERWMTNIEAAERAGVNPRTLRHHTTALERLGVLLMVKAHGGYRFKLNPEPGPAAQDYLRRWEEVRELFQPAAGVTGSVS